MGMRSIKMPDVGEGVAEAEIVEWAVKVGDLVKEDQVVAAVMTDKATVDIPTPVAGSVLALGGVVGDVLAVGSELIRIDAPGMPDRASSAAKSSPQKPEPEPAPTAKPEAVAPAPRAAPPTSARGAEAAPRRSSNAQGRAAPARREAACGARCAPEGARGRRRSQIRARLGTCGTHHARGPRRLYRPPAGAPSKAAGRAPNEAVETIKVVGMRRRIAENMAESARRVAHFSYVEEVDVTALEELRAALNARATEARPKLTLLPFLMLGIVKAVAEFPADQRPLRRRERNHHALRRGASWASRRKRRTGLWCRSFAMPRRSACTNARAKCGG